MNVFWRLHEVFSFCKALLSPEAVGELHCNLCWFEWNPQCSTDCGFSSPDFPFTPETKNFSGRRAWRTSQPTRPQRKMLRRSHSGPAPLDLLWSNGITWRERSNFTVTSCILYCDCHECGSSFSSKRNRTESLKDVWCTDWDDLWVFVVRPKASQTQKFWVLEKNV